MAKSKKATFSKAATLENIAHKRSDKDQLNNNLTATQNQPVTPGISAASQCQRVLLWLRNQGNLTAQQGIHELDVPRLASRIRELRVRGHLIITRRIHETTAKGSTHLVGQYFLTPSKQLNLWDWQGQKVVK